MMAKNLSPRVPVGEKKMDPPGVTVASDYF